MKIDWLMVAALVACLAFCLYVWTVALYLLVEVI